ncbi:RICIN domain-containing protein [Streptomyces albicerus]|uniref:RICIN domain-containing protein n=1 Tax=Streptomyces albicerus TaxID=2569859 RepID=UPI00124B8215|nr:hypothetical protein [Streptomyces albicerus]
MPTSRKLLALTAALSFSTLSVLSSSGTAVAEPDWTVPTGQAVTIDHVLTDTHITSHPYEGNTIADLIELFEDYDPHHLAGEKWIFRATRDSEAVLIQNSGGDFCLQPEPGADVSAGTWIVQRPCSVGKKTQWWLLNGASPRDFTLRLYEDDGLAITPANNERYSRLRLGQTDGPEGHLNQHFRVR